MTLAELEKELDERGLSMTVHQPSPEWSVWLFCSDDPALGIFPGTGVTVEEAVAKALSCWDSSGAEEIVLPS